MCLKKLQWAKMGLNLLKFAGLVKMNPIQIGPKYVSQNLLTNGSLLSQTIHSLWKETKLQNRIDTPGERRYIQNQNEELH